MILIDKIVPGGQCISTLEDGKKAFFWNALPGETVVDYIVTKKKSSYIECVATKIKNKSNERIDPEDECYLSTSPWQIMKYDYELKCKTEIIKEVYRQNDISIDKPEILTDGNVYNYRNKMEYSLYYDVEKEKISLAFHRRGSHQKIPINKSSIERPEIFEKACEIINELNEKHEEARKYQTLLLRCNKNGRVEGGLFENGKPHPVFPNLDDEILGYKYSYSPNGFFQINLPVYEMALNEIKKYVDTDNVLDLYSGVGTIGLSVARNKKLVLVECNKDAFHELKNNITDGLVAINSNSEDALEYIQPDQTVIVDPPRAGCDKKLIDKLLEIRPKKIIYLSCDPATQARDVKMLLEKYEIENMKAFNFFPRTPHIENLVILK